MADPRSTPLDTAPVEAVVAGVLDAQAAVVTAVRAVAPAIGEAVEVAAGRLASGGRLLLVAAGGVAGPVLDLAVTDLVPDFGLDPAAVRHGGPADLADWRPTGRDAVVVVAVRLAPEVTAALDTSRRARAGSVLVTIDRVPTAGIDVVVRPELAPGPVRGVDRLGAATALTAVLDAFTTALVAQLGRVHGDLPVDLVATDDDTRARAVAMVAELAGVDEARARGAAEAAGHDVRIAVLALVGGLSTAEAALLATQHRTLRDAFANLPKLPRD